MTLEHLAFVESANAAERAGDAATALEYHQGIPMFSRSAHRVLLTQLVGLAEEMTPWLWARWAAYQATRAEDRGTMCGDIVKTAQERVITAFHAAEWERMYIEGRDPVPYLARVLGQDWVYHQICTFDLGGLETFLDELATGRLSEEGRLAREWCQTSMGGYQLVSSEPWTLRVRDLASGDVLDLLDLGAAVHAREGGWLVGRMVPSGGSPAWMFDSRPLPVDQRTAEAIAADGTQWVTVLADAIGTGGVDREVLSSEDRELATDVPGLALLEAGTRPTALASARAGLRSGRDEIGRVAFRILREAAHGRWDPARAVYVAAAAVHPHGFAEARRMLMARPDVWEPWVALTPEPARSRLRRLGTPDELNAA